MSKELLKIAIQLTKEGKMVNMSLGDGIFIHGDKITLMNETGTTVKVSNSIVKNEIYFETRQLMSVSCMTGKEVGDDIPF